MNSGNSRITFTLLSAVALALVAGLAPAFGAEEKSAGRECSVASLSGTYGFYRTGNGPWGNPPGGPLAAAGIVSFDGAGNYNTVQNISRGGEIFLDEEYEGNYSIAPDCTGDIDGGLWFVIVDDGKSFYGLTLFEGFTAYYVATRIHAGRGNAR